MIQSSDILKLSSKLMVLLREHEIEKACALVNDARKGVLAEDHDCRADTIDEINGHLFALKLEKEKILCAIDCLPENLRLDAMRQIRPLIEEFFEQKINILRSEKRKHSLPRH